MHLPAETAATFRPERFMLSTTANTFSIRLRIGHRLVSGACSVGLGDPSVCVCVCVFFLVRGPGVLSLTRC